MEGCQGYAVEVHDLITESEGGPDSFDNLQMLCKRHYAGIMRCGG